MRRFTLVFAAAALAGQSFAIVFPTGAHAAYNYIPFGAGATSTVHQVFASTLFSGLYGGAPVQITGIGFAPGVTGTFGGDVTINLGYTNAIPGVASSAGGLQIPTAGGGGGPNSLGSMSTFYANPTYSVNLTTIGSFTEFLFNGNFTYNPAGGNLLVEFVVNSPTGPQMPVSRAAGSAESSRAYTSTTYGNTESPTTATRMDFTTSPVPEPASMAALSLGLLALLRRRKA